MLTWRHTPALRTAFSAKTLLQGFLPSLKRAVVVSPPKATYVIHLHSVPLYNLCTLIFHFKLLWRTAIQTNLKLFSNFGRHWLKVMSHRDWRPTTSTTSIANSIRRPDRHLFSGSGFCRLGGVFLTPRFRWTHIKGLLHNGNCWWPKWLLYQMDCRASEATTHASVRSSQSN